LEAGPRLLRGTSEKAARHAAAVLGGRGVVIITGERLQGAPDSPADVFSHGGVAVTDRGREVPYDLLIWCTGSRPNTAYMRPALESALDANGRIRVTPELRVVGHERLLALGDITDLDENKMAWHITGQVKVAAANLRRLFEAAAAASAGAPAGAPAKVPPPATWQAYRPKTGNPTMAVSLGSREGVLHLPMLGVVRSPWFNRKAKAGHLLVPRYRALLNVP
jgi:NADH dehydrogenase FAD-containing subunit